MIRKANGNLHYFINGLDQGVAASRLPSQVRTYLLSFLYCAQRKLVNNVIQILD